MTAKVNLTVPMTFSFMISWIAEVLCTLSMGRWKERKREEMKVMTPFLLSNPASPNLFSDRKVRSISAEKKRSYRRY